MPYWLPGALELAFWALVATASGAYLIWLGWDIVRDLKARRARREER